MIRPTSHFLFLTFKCQSITVVLVIPPAVAGKIVWNKVLSILPYWHLPWCFLAIRSSHLSEFCYGARIPYEVVHDRLLFLEKLFLPQKLGKWAKNKFFFNLKKNLVTSFQWICSIMNMFIICSVPAQILYFGKILLFRCRAKCYQSIRSLDF